MGLRASDDIERLDAAAGNVPTPVWAADRGRKFDNLSDVRREMVSVYWLWRRAGRLSVGHMGAAVQALQVIAKTFEAERDQRVAELEAKIAEFEQIVQMVKQARAEGNVLELSSKAVLVGSDNAKTA